MSVPDERERLRPYAYTAVATVAYVAAVWVTAWHSSGKPLAIVAIGGLLALAVGIAVIGARAGIRGRGVVSLIGVSLVVGVAAYAVGAVIALLGFTVEGFPEDSTITPPLSGS